MEPGQMVEDVKPHEIFLIPEVRTMIIKHVIHDDDGKLLVDEVKKCREVCPSWTGSTTEALRQSKEPLFHFRLDETYFLEGTEYHVWKLKVLDLKETVGMEFPPIALHVYETYFRGSTPRTIMESMETLKDILIYLDINLRYKTSLRYYPEVIDLPMLKDLRIKFGDGGIPSVVPLLQRFHEGCPALRELTLESDVHHYPRRSLDIGGLALLERLTSLDLSKVGTHFLGALATTSLPNLKRLSFLISQTRWIMRVNSLEAGLITRILDNVRNTLEYLRITDEGWAGDPYYFRFPVMDKLTEMDLNSGNIELEGGIHSLETYLPKLARLRLNNQTLPMLQPWINSTSRIPSVTNLSMKCWYKIRERLAGRMIARRPGQLPARNNPVVEPRPRPDFHQETVEQIAETFPNLKEFTIELVPKWCNMNMFPILFRELTELEKLKICVDHEDQDFWNAALLGVSLQAAKSICGSGGLGLNHNFNASTSISSLSNLKELWLEKPSKTTTMVRANKAKGLNPPLANLLFENVLLTMPHLKKLTLQGNIWTSLEVKEQWEASGRQLILLDA